MYVFSNLTAKLKKNFYNTKKNAAILMCKTEVLLPYRIITVPAPFQRYQYQQYQPVLLIFVGQTNLSIIITTFAPELKQHIRCE